MYTYAVRNTGNVNLGPPYTIADSDLAVPAMICPSTTNPLLPSAAVTCGTYKYTTSIGDMSLEFLQRTATATAMNGASVLTATNTLKVPRFMCDAAHVTGPWTPAVPPLTSDIILNLTNTSGQDIHIASLTISWSSGPPYLTNVYWNTVQKWSGLSPSSGGFYVPIDVGGFLLTNGGPAIPLEMKLTGAPAWTNVQATFVENGCSVVNWKLGP